MTRIEIEKALTDFLNCQGFFPRTNAIHRQHVAGLMRHAALLGDDPLSSVNLASYLNSLRPVARVRAWGVLKKFFAWLHDEGQLEKSPLSRIPRPRALLQPRLGFHRDQLMKILEVLEDNTKTRRVIHDLGAFRLKVMVMLTLTHGLRVGELIKLDRNQYDPKAGIF